MAKKTVIIGASAGGISAARWLAKLMPDDEIILISAEEKPYNKCLLVDYLAGQISQDKLLLPSPVTPNIANYMSTYADNIDRVNQVVTTSHGLKVNYDNLILAMGSSAWIPPLPALHEARNSFTFHSLDDACALKKIMQEKQPKHIAIVGAGLTGIECADALVKAGVKVSLIDQAEHILPSLLTSDEASFLQQHIANDVNLYLDVALDDIQVTDHKITSLVLSNNTMLAPDAVVVTTGVRQNNSLIKNVGLDQSENGLMVDEYMRTSDDHIWAVGDLIEISDPVTGKKQSSSFWADAMLQGMIAAHAIAGKTKKYPFPHQIVQTQVFGFDIAVCGNRNRSTLARNKEGEQCFVNLSEDHKLKEFSYIGNGQSYKIKLIQALKSGRPFEL